MEAHQTAGTSSSTGVPNTTADTNVTHAKEFLTSGRTGRRNALPDILGEHALVTSSDLPARLQSLTTNDSSEPSTQGKGDSGKS